MLRQAIHEDRLQCCYFCYDGIAVIHLWRHAVDCSLLCLSRFSSLCLEFLCFWPFDLLECMLFQRSCFTEIWQRFLKTLTAIQKISQHCPLSLSEKMKIKITKHLFDYYLSQHTAYVRYCLNNNQQQHKFYRQQVQ